MARTTGVKTEKPVEAEAPAIAEVEAAEVTETISEPISVTPEPDTEEWAIDDCLNALKTLLSTVEKLQKVRQEVGDVKPLLMRMLNGEVSSGEDLEQLKTGVAGLSRLVRAYGDHQTALTKAQPARELLDQVLKGTKPAE